MITPRAEVRIVLQWGDEDNFVAIDGYSGGYPWKVKALMAYDFGTVERAANYASQFKEDALRVRKMTVSYTLEVES